MKVLGISGKERHAAAAVSIDGAVAAAAAEESFARVRHIGYRHTGGYPLSAIDACLTRASLTYAEIDRVIVVDDECSGEDDPRHDSSAEAGPTVRRRRRPGRDTRARTAHASARVGGSRARGCAPAHRRVPGRGPARDRAGTGSRRIGDLRTARGAADAAAWCTPAVLRDQANGRCARLGRVRAVQRDRKSGGPGLGPALAAIRTSHHVGAGPRLRAERRGARTCDCAAARERGSIRVGHLAQYAPATGPPGTRCQFLRARGRGRDRHDRADGRARGSGACRADGQPAVEPRARDRSWRGRSATRRSLRQCPTP